MKGSLQDQLTQYSQQSGNAQGLFREGVQLYQQTQQQARSTATQRASVPTPSGFPLGADYVDVAENRMKIFMQDDRNRRNLTTSKIRNILSMVSELLNEIKLTHSDTLSDEMQERIQYLRIRLAYESGREQVVKSFVTNMKLLECVKGIGDSKERFMRFANYMEALVAYHRFFGGNDK